MSPSQNIEHYDGPADNPPTLATALPPEQSETAQSCPKLFCLYRKPCDDLCWQRITCQSLSRHMQTEHGVYEKPGDECVDCRWLECSKQIKRHNIYRHYKETHLGHKRGVGHS
ncbi:hypothetical protein PISMIDRAFT_684317 [Pisolithus microcarpus 441]|uniref:C2H2-type domain-containing protein n=1 Tax=Pisolithus microcarpus 441 TaxID=765257 RepID=A0A0C9Z783_9AGAM|nr:hypothetical protein BKA83DRAFT_684317 [Pisolithus microcarpus]KIK18282.1 hypothetical protein PISMIDRAFT_684317 [Pisolithus microcarpus 441]